MKASPGTSTLLGGGLPRKGRSPSARRSRHTEDARTPGMQATSNPAPCIASARSRAGCGAIAPCRRFAGRLCGSGGGLRLVDGRGGTYLAGRRSARQHPRAVAGRDEEVLQQMTLDRLLQDRDMREPRIDAFRAVTGDEDEGNAAGGERVRQWID